MSANTQPTYVYDGECVICSRAVRYILRYDTSDPPIRFVAIKSRLGRKLALHAGVDPEKPHSFVYLEDGASYVLSDAVFAMSKRAGGPGRHIRIFRVVPRSIRDWFYARLANNRYRLFGKLEACYLPDPSARHRFVLESDQPPEP